MRLHNAHQAIVNERKIRDYLLSMSHPGGRGKARFFMRYGFRVDAWQVLAEALRDHALLQVISRHEETAFGTRYAIHGILISPDGRNPRICSVWFLRRGHDIPELVTAYPLRKGE